MLDDKVGRRSPGRPPKVGRRSPGRPPKGDEAKRTQFNTRLRVAVRDRINDAAIQAGRSLSEEIEFRLERSLDDQNRLKEALELALGPRVAGITLLSGFAAKAAGDHAMVFSGGPLNVSERPWLENPFAFSQVSAAIAEIIKGVKPDGEPVEPALLQSLPSDELREVARNSGRAAAAAVCRAIAFPDDSGPLGPWARVINEWLGEEAVGRIRKALGEDDQP